MFPMFRGAPAAPAVPMNTPPTECIPMAAVQELRAKLLARPEARTAEAQRFLCDANLVRYLTKFSSGGKCRSVDEAEEMLRDTLKWRAIHLDGRNLNVSPAMIANPTACSFMAVGVDPAGRPVVYGCPARASSSDVEETMTHVAYGLERVMPAGGPRQTWVWIADFHGFGAKHINIPLAVKMAKVFKAHYRERMHALYLVDPPKTLDAMLKVVQPLATQNTLSKVRTVKGPAEFEALVQNLLPGDALGSGWLRAVYQLPGAPGSLPPLPPNWHPHFGRVLACPTAAALAPTNAPR